MVVRGAIRLSWWHLAERLARPPSTQGYLHQLYAVSGWSSLCWLAVLRHETLIMDGDEDPLMPRHQCPLMAALMPRLPAARFRGAGHLFLLDEPGSVVADLNGS